MTTCPVSLVAFYGNKNATLGNFLENLISQIHSELGDNFVPYTIDQIHATVAGMECFVENREIFNHNFYLYHHEKRQVKLADLHNFFNSELESAAFLPMSIQIGGFKKIQPAKFHSFGQHPWARSFFIQGDKVVTIGWPIYQDSHSLQLYKLRRKLEQFGILHKWHSDHNNQDNDCYIVLGNVKEPEKTPERIDNAVLRIRRLLSESRQVCFSMTINDLSIVRYDDTTLPRGSTQSIPLRFAIEQPNRLLSFFEACVS